MGKYKLVKKLKKSVLSLMTREDLYDIRTIAMKNLLKINNELMKRDNKIIKEKQSSENATENETGDEGIVKSVPPLKQITPTEESILMFNAYRYNLAFRNIGASPTTGLFQLRLTYYMYKNMKEGIMPDDKLMDIHLGTTAEWVKSMKSMLLNKDDDNIHYHFSYIFNESPFKRYVYSADITKKIGKYVMDRDTLKEYDGQKFYEHIGILKSVFIIYTCIGNNFVGNMLWTKLIDRLAKLEIFFTTKKDYSQHCSFLKIYLPCLEYDFSRNTFAAHIPSLSYKNPEFELAPYTQKFLEFEDTENLLISGYNKKYYDASDHVVMYSFSKFNESLDDDVDGIDARFQSKRRDELFSELSDIINEIYLKFSEWINNPNKSALSGDNTINSREELISKIFKML